MSNKNISEPNNSCADCAYHHCKKSCMKGDNKKLACIYDGECLYTGEVNRKCFEKRCEHFKQWRPE